MRRVFFHIALYLSLSACIYSCKDNKGSHVDYATTPVFDTNRQTIIYRENRQQDIKGNIDVPYSARTNSFNYSCSFSFYNYGDDICLYNGCLEDEFIFGFEINYAHSLERDDKIVVVSKKHNAKYGDWALVNLTIGDKFFTDVFMTPLAMKAYKNGDDSYILVQFVASNKHMNVLFYAGPIERLVVSTCPDAIITHYDMTYNIDAPLNGPGQFWKLN